MATNPITVTVSRLRSGSADRPIATPAKETIAFRGIDIPAGTSIALISRDGITTLAHTVSTDAPNGATLDTATIEAFAAAPLNPQHTAPATLVIGTPDELIAAIPVTLVRNPLESITPPTESAPTYPTSEDLAKILAQITAASDAAEDAASAAEKSARDAEEAHADIRRAIDSLTADDIAAGAQGTRTFNTAAGADNWGTAWGVALNLATLDPDGGALPGADVRIASISLRTSASSFTARAVRLLLRAADGTETTSANTVTPTATSQEMAFTFAGDGAPLAGGTGDLFFADEDAEGEHVPVSLRILAVGAQPEGNAILIASSGARRADLFPELSISYSVQGTVKDALDALAESVAGGGAKPGADNDFTGTNLFSGILRMANPRVSADPDDATKDISLVPNANGAGLQVQFPGGATAMIRAKTGTLATTAEVGTALTGAKTYTDNLVGDIDAALAQI